MSWIVHIYRLSWQNLSCIVNIYRLCNITNIFGLTWHTWHINTFLLTDPSFPSLEWWCVNMDSTIVRQLSVDWRTQNYKFWSWIGDVKKFPIKCDLLLSAITMRLSPPPPLCWCRWLEFAERVHYHVTRLYKSLFYFQLILPTGSLVHE